MVSHRFLVQTEHADVRVGLFAVRDSAVAVVDAAVAVVDAAVAVVDAAVAGFICQARQWWRLRLMLFSEKLIQAISCSANGIPLGHQLLRIAMDAVGGLASSAVAEMMFQRASVDVCTCVHRTHALLDGLQVSMGQWDHRFIFNPRPLKRCPLAQGLPLVPLYIQEVSRHQPHVTRSCGHSPRSPQLRGPMQQTQVTRSSAEYWPWPEKSEHRGHMWVIVSLYCWGLQENASRVCGRETTE